MTKGLVRSNARGKPARSAVVKLNIPIVNLAIAVAGVTGIGWGTSTIRGLPEGNVLLLGAVANLQFSTASAGMVAAWTGNFGIGSAPTADSTLTGTEVDIIASTALSAATAKVSPLVRAVNAAQAILDNTAADLELNLSLIVADLDISADSSVLANGFLSIAYIVLGDD